MSDTIKSMIPTFGKQEPKKEIANAISILQNQGLLPKDTVNKNVLDKQDEQLTYIAIVYRNLVVAS